MSSDNKFGIVSVTSFLRSQNYSSISGRWLSTFVCRLSLPFLLSPNVVSQEAVFPAIRATETETEVGTRQSFKHRNPQLEPQPLPLRVRVNMSGSSPERWSWTRGVNPVILTCRTLIPVATANVPLTYAVFLNTNLLLLEVMVWPHLRSGVTCACQDLVLITALALLLSK